MAFRFALCETSHVRRSPRRLRPRGRVFVALAGCCLCISAAWAQNPCSVVSGGATPTSADVAAAINMAIGNTACTLNIEAPNTCTVITVQRVINASLGQPCSVYSAHAANLSWTASVTPNVTYNVYRGTASAGPFTQINSSAVTGTTYADTTVQAGQTYYYVVTAVAISGGAQSAYSSPPVQATIPSP